MLIRWGALSDTGVLRVQNEDSMLAQEGLFVVADGMGGHNAGEVASAMATSMLKSAHANGITDAKELGDLIKEINVQIFQSAAAKTEQSGMGTTLTALAITPSDQTLGENSVATATVANIGDSRTYLLRNGEFRQVSVDHSYVQELVSDGLITREEARTHARRNIVTRALGIEPVVGVDTWTLPLIAGDRYVLCSDGLVDEVTDADIATCLKRITDPQETANELVAMANTNGGRDNITVIVVDVLVESDKPETKPEAKSGVTKLSSSFIRKLIISTAVSIVAVVAIVFITSYIRSGYFVDYENNKPDARVLIYRGKNFMWINPTIEADSTLIRTDLSAALAKEVTGQPGFDSALDAQNYVNQIRDVVETVLSPITSTTKP
jgi:serine/threonine protein phosphatase PrpC